MKSGLWNGIFGMCLAAMMLWQGCQSVPLTGRHQLMLSTEKSENTLGEQAWTQLLGQYETSKTPMYVHALERVGPAIRDVSGRPDFKWEFRVLESSEPNAFCLPGGKVAVYSGLFPYISNDAELATVVAHEIGHALARHGGERMTLEGLKDVGSAALQLSGADGQRWLELYGVGTQVGALLPFSRKHEYEADQMGLILMARAGYNPTAAISFWKKFAAAGGATALTEWASTHPSGDNRIQQLNSLMTSAMAEYQKAPVKHGLGKNMPNSQ